MQKILAPVFIIIFCIINAQNKAPEVSHVYHVTGQFKENYRVPRTSENLQRLLFVLEKGDMYLPENFGFLHLSPKDTATFKAKDILIVPLFASYNDLFFNYNKDFSFEIIPIPGVKDGYYTKNMDWFNAHNQVKLEQIKKCYSQKIFSAASLQDTMVAGCASYRDFRDLPKWISIMDSNAEVSTHGVGCAETSTGYKSIHSYGKAKLSELAKERLLFAHRFMQDLGAPDEDGTKKDWQSWMQSLQKKVELMLADNSDFKDYRIRFKEEGYGKVGYDSESRNLVRLNGQTNFTNYEDQQVVLFSTEQNNFNVYKIFSPQQRAAKYFTKFYSKNDTLTTLSRQFVWAKYVRPEGNSGSDFYNEVDKKQLLQAIEPVKDFLNESNEWEMDESFLSDDAGFILYHNKNSADYNLISFNAKSGAVISHATIREKLGAAGDYKYLPFHYEQETGKLFTVLMKINNVAHHLVFDKELTKIEDINLGTDFRWYPHFLNTKKSPGRAPFYYDTSDDNLLIYNLKEGKLQTQKIKMPDHIFDNSQLLPEGQNFRLFYEYGDAFFHGLQSVLLNGKTFEPTGKPTVYFRTIQTEEESSENTPGHLQIVPTADGYLISFNFEKDWHVIKVPSKN